MRETLLGDPGVGQDAVTGPLTLTTAHVNFSDLRTINRTLYVVLDGPEFDTITAEGQLPGDIWVTVIGTDGEALAISTEASGVYVIGADYLGLRVVAAGGTDPVEAYPEHEPPIEAVEGSTLTAGIIG
jgi:hypothetical protein